MIDLRSDVSSDISKLYSFNQDLARRFDNFRSIINTPTKSIKDVGKNNLSKESSILKLRELITQIRIKIGFEDFQDLPLIEKLFETLPNQGIVILNITSFRIDTFFFHSDKRIQVLPLD